MPDTIAVPISKPAHIRLPGTQGRHTEYLPEYCGIVEKLAQEKGYSPAQLATVLRISKATLYKWAGDYPDFKDSLARAKTFEQAYWEQIGHKALNRKHFQAQVWSRSMAARFKDDYTETKNSVELTLNLSDVLAMPVAQVDAVVEKLEPPKT